MPSKIIARAVLLCALALVVRSTPAIASVGAAADPSPSILPAWGDADAWRLGTTDPLFAERLASMAKRSAFVRARLDALQESGASVLIATPEQARSLGLSVNLLQGNLGTTVFQSANGLVTHMVVLVDLREMQSRSYRARLSYDKRMEDLDTVLAHELIVHAGSVAAGGRKISANCADPTPEELRENGGQNACSMQEENLIRMELRTSLGLRLRYHETQLHLSRTLGFAGV